ncbi:unnamed protein product [Ectocarpus fasciculatus]
MASSIEKVCELCRINRVEGTLCGIVLAVSCLKCATDPRFSSRASVRNFSVGGKGDGGGNVAFLTFPARGMDRFKATKTPNLTELGNTTSTTKNPHYKGRRPTVLYVRAEIEALRVRERRISAEKIAKDRKEKTERLANDRREKAEKLEKERREKGARIEILKTDHDIDPDLVTNEDLKNAIFGDVLDSDTPFTSLQDVRQAYRFKDQAAKTVPADPVRALNFFLQNVDFFTSQTTRTVPGDSVSEIQRVLQSVVDTLSSPSGSDEALENDDQAMFDTFWRTNDIIQGVIGREGPSVVIVSFLNPGDVKRLEQSNMKRLVYNARFISEKCQARRRIGHVIQRVVGQEGLSAAIVSLLCPADVRRLQQSSMRQIASNAKFVSERSDARRRLCCEIEQLGGIPDVDAFLEDPAVLERVTRYETHCACMDVGRVARKLHEFYRLRGDPAARREMLSEAMEAEGMRIRGDSTFCREFINGSTDVDLGEIVGRMKLAKHLFDLGGHVTWSKNREAANAKFKELFHMEGLSMKESFKKSIEGCRPERVPLYEYDQYE